MQIAKDFLILRGIKADGRVSHALERKPLKVATLLDEEQFNRNGHGLLHNRTVQRLARQAEGCSAGVYWTQAQVAEWHPDDFEALGARLTAAGIQAMTIRGELCFHVEP